MDTTGVTQGNRILLADADAPVRASLNLLPSVNRQLVTQATGADEAMLFFTCSKYDLVIVD